jgi:hypothetical protein
MTSIANDNMKGFKSQSKGYVILSFLLRTTTELDLELYFPAICLSEPFSLRTWSKVQLIDSNHIRTTSTNLSQMQR